jgi:predicted Ser/Thr protein kinase
VSIPPPEPHASAPPALPAELGEFRIRGLLGEGGSGTVYDAEWGQRRVALKVLRRELVPGPKEQERFLAEARLLGAVDHAAVVKVLGSGSLPDGRPYLAMEKVDGESLAARVARGGLPADEALAIFDQLASAIAALHERGLIHRDIKPENVLVSGRRAVLLDFGIAKPEGAPPSTSTREGLLRGTPAYMAPERFFGTPASVATDVYELAVVLYAMLAGRLPWTNLGDPSARLNPPAPSSFGCRLAEPLEVELLRALSTRAEARPPSAAEFARRVRESARGGAGESARRTASLPAGAAAMTPGPTALAPGRTTVRRWRRLAAFGVGGAALVAVAVVLALRLADRGGDQLPAPAKPGVAAAADAGVPPVDVRKPPAAPIAPAPAQPDRPAPADLLAYLPRDTEIVLGASIRELRASPLYAAIRRHEEESGPAPPTLQQMLQALCGLGLDNIDSLAVGIGSGDVLDIAAQGMFTRLGLENCLAAFLGSGTEPAPIRRAGPVTEIAGERTVRMVWLSEGMVLLTTRPRVDAIWWKARVKREDSALERPELMSFVDRVDPAAVIWLAGTPRGLLSTLLPGAADADGVYVSMLADRDLVIQVGLHHATAAAAAKTAAALNRQLDDVRKDLALAGFFGDAAFAVVGTHSVLTLTLDELRVNAILGTLGTMVRE